MPLQEEQNKTATPVVSAPPPGQKTTLLDAREELRMRYRVKPDRRFLKAIAFTHQFFSGQPEQPVDISYRNQKWTIAYRGEAVGDVSEFPSFVELYKVLSEWAIYTAALESAPSIERAEAITPVLEANLSQGRLDTKYLVETIVKSTANAGNQNYRAEDLLLAARCFALLNLRSLDVMGVADDVSARALALTAISAVAPTNDSQLKAHQRRNQCLLAISQGYFSDAKELARSLPDTDAIKMFSCRQKEQLAKLAIAGSDDLVEFLYLKLLSQSNDSAGWQKFAQRHVIPNKHMTLPALATYENLLSWDYLVPYSTLLAAAVMSEAENHFEQKQGLNISQLIGKFEYLPDQAMSLPENWLTDFERNAGKAASGPGTPLFDRVVVEQFYRGYFYSAIFFLTHGLLESPLPEVNCRYLERAVSTKNPSSPLAEWIRTRAFLRLGKENKSPTELLTHFSNLGLAARAALYLDFAQTSFDRPAKIKAGETLFKLADTRPGSRRVLAQVAEDFLFYFKLARTTYLAAKKTGEIIVPGSMMSGSQLHFDATRLSVIFEARKAGLEKEAKSAGITADKELSTLIGNLSMREALELLAALERTAPPQLLLTEYGKLYRKEPNSWPLTSQYVSFLVRSNRTVEAQRLAEDFLKASPSGPAIARARALVAETLFAQGKLKDALEILSSTDKFDERNCLRMRILCLYGLGRHDDAQAWAEDLVKHYSNASQPVAVAAWVMWKNEQYRLAAQLLRKAKITGNEWKTLIGPAFVDVFSNHLDKAELAVNALSTEDLSGGESLGQLARSAHESGAAQLGYWLTMWTTVPPIGKSQKLLTAYSCLRDWKGEKTAIEWLKKTVPEDRKNEFGRLSFFGFERELLWQLIPLEPKGENSDVVWIMRAVDASSQTAQLTNEQKDVLTEHYRKTDGLDSFIGRVLLGMDKQDVLLKTKLSPVSIPKVAFYIGWRMLSAKDEFNDACEWMYMASASQDNLEETVYANHILSAMALSMRRQGLTFENVDVNHMIVLDQTAYLARASRKLASEHDWTRQLFSDRWWHEEK